MLKKLKLQAPLAVLAELSHRCPLSCAYCSYTIELIQKNKELEALQIQLLGLEEEFYPTECDESLLTKLG